MTIQTIIKKVERYTKIMQMNVTSPSFTGKTAYTKDGNEFTKSNGAKLAGFGVGAAALAGTYIYANKDTLRNVKMTEVFSNMWTGFTGALGSVKEGLNAINKESVKNFFVGAKDSVVDGFNNFKFKESLTSIKESFKNIDYKALGKSAGKYTVIALPLIGLALGLGIDKIVDHNRAKKADMNA